ncbi:hypothetical protein [Rubrivivax sp. JA1026]|uniref:hypothetical protein n=1 Tax=Rubrivivax sp. JA1026 TaxID=2710888 RepID=UPI0013E9871E|nr:hypothetical protein [Rubrivivax sp. JA1026]
MSLPPKIHLSICQPLGYVHSLGLLDPARYFRWQFRRLGAEVSIAKNRLRHDAVNFVFGAHLGFDASLCRRHACVFVNLEQLGDRGASVRPEYLKLLAANAVVDYDADNVAAYAQVPDEVPVVPFWHAPYLAPAVPLPLEERPIDLLFFGSMNDRRKAMIDRIEALGWTVTVFDSALYGEERDHYIRQAKAVLNCHFYDSARFEQVRVAHCLSLGTPVISERTPDTRPDEAFEDCVIWLQDENELVQFFSEDFATPAYYDVTRAALQRFEAADPLGAYAAALGFAEGFVGTHHECRPAEPWAPERIHIGSGKDYRPGWLNVDVLARAEPDLLLDLSGALELPLHADSPTVGPLVLAADSVDRIDANNVLEHVGDLPALMSNCLRLLKEGGEFHIEVPHERALTAWQDPTHVRAMNENSWIYYTDWFWYLGWVDHRFEVAASSWLDAKVQPCQREQAAFMRVVLRKIRTTPRERMVALTMAAGVHLPDDEPVAPAAAGEGPASS